MPRVSKPITVAPWITIPVAIGTSIAFAQQPTVPASVLACAALGQDVERLACYDRAIAALRSGGTDAAAAAAASPEQLFGVRGQLTQRPRAEKPPDRQDLRTISARVSRLGASEGAPWIELDNGQVWRVLSGDAVTLLHVGDTVAISRAAFGSFRLSTANGRFAKVNRVR